MARGVEFQMLANVASQMTSYALRSHFRTHLVEPYLLSPGGDRYERVYAIMTASRSGGR
jgi:hypothetical protein